MAITLMATTPMEAITRMVTTPTGDTMGAMEDITVVTGLMATDTATASWLGWVMDTGAATTEDTTATTDRSELRSSF